MLDKIILSIFLTGFLFAQERNIYEDAVIEHELNEELEFCAEFDVDTDTVKSAYYYNKVKGNDNTIPSNWVRVPITREQYISQNFTGIDLTQAKQNKKIIRNTDVDYRVRALARMCGKYININRNALGLPLISEDTMINELATIVDQLEAEDISAGRKK